LLPFVRFPSVTDYFSSSPLFFGRRVIDVQIATTSAAHDRLVQKIALTAIVDQADNSSWSSCVDRRVNVAVRPIMRRNRRTQPARQPTYIRLRARVDRLEDAISHFYNVITELRRRVSTLEKKLKPLAKGD
jgi:hypothetical protein